MESGKRKRGEKEKNEERKKMNKVIGKAEEEATEEEVEEFFAILRRMQEAVKYFGEGWRAAVETAAIVEKKANEVEDDQEEIKEKDESNGVLDLNAEPDKDSSSHLAD